MITDKDNNPVMPHITEQLLEKFKLIKSYKTYNIVMTILVEGFIKSQDLATKTSQTINYIEELLEKINKHQLVQKYLGEDNQVYYAVHSVLINDLFACNGCKHAKVKKHAVSSSKAVNIIECTLRKGVHCSRDYYRKVTCLRRILRGSGYKLQTYLKKTKAKTVVAMIDKELDDWNSRTFTDYFYLEFTERFQKRMVHKINKKSIQVSMNTLCRIFREDYYEDANFYLFNYINYNFTVAQAEGRKVSHKIMTEPKQIKKFAENEVTMSSKKCTIHNMYCPYFKGKQCRAGVKCSKRLRKKIKKHYNL